MPQAPRAGTMPGMADTWAEWLGAWIVHQKAAGAPRTTIRVRRDHILQLCSQQRRRSPGSLTTKDLAEWMAGQDWAPNTLRSVRSSLRAFYAWAALDGRIEASPAAALPSVRVPRGKPRPLPEDVYRAALARADDRLWLALRLAGQCGLRRGEVARVRTDHVEADLLGHSLRVVGKGGHVRMVPLPEDLADALAHAPPGWVFPSPEGGHLSEGYMGELVADALPAGWTMHSLRHRAASVAYAMTRDLRAVQELLGHASVSTTQGYAAVAGEAVRAAMLAAA